METEAQNTGGRTDASQTITTAPVFDVVPPQSAASIQQATDQPAVAAAPTAQPAPAQVAPGTQVSTMRPPSRYRRKAIPLRTKIIAGVFLLALALIIFLIWISLNQPKPVQSNRQTDRFNPVAIPLEELSAAELVSIGDSRTVSINGQLRVNGSMVIAPTAKPDGAVTGQLYFDQDTKQLSYYNGSEFMNLVGSPASVQGGGDSVTNITNVTNASGTVTATGTPGRIPKFNGVQSLGDSIISDMGTHAAVNGNFNLINSTPSGAPVSGWDNAATPAVIDTLDNAAVELGIKFQTDVSGFVKSVRFYKGPTNTGTHRGSLWTGNGTLLASGTFTNETASGWQELVFPTPVPVVADTTYVASYHTTVGRYSVTTDYFNATSVDNGTFHILRDGVDGGNGVFKYSATPTFPNLSFHASNYWVDAVFAPNPSPGTYQINGVQIATTDLADKSNIAKRSTSQLFSGINTFRNGVDSTTAFSIQQSDTTALFRVDTIAARVIIKDLVVSDDLYLARHIITDALAPPLIAAGTAACTAPTVTVVGNDMSGTITVTTGTGCVGVGKLATLTFRLPYALTPRALLTPANANAAGLSTYVDSSTISTTAFDLQVSGGTITDTTTYKWYYWAVQ